MRLPIAKPYNDAKKFCRWEIFLRNALLKNRKILKRHKKVGGINHEATYLITFLENIF
jgi:hypothetical protein